MPNARDVAVREDKQTKHWSITINNPIEGVDYALNHPEGQGLGQLYFPWARNAEGTRLLAAVWGQLERGEEGTPHLQIYVVTTKIFRSKSFGRQVNDVLWPNADGKGRAHCEPVKSITAMKDYVTKEDTRVYGPMKHGLIHCRGGDQAVEAKQSATKQLIKDVHKVIRGTRGVRDLWVDHAPMMLLRHKGVNEMIKALSAPEPRPNMKTIVLYGTAGTGKTHLAREIANELFPQELDVFIKNQTKWWDGYVGQPCVIMDDFQGTGIGADQLKVLFDKSPMIAECKGGSVPVRTELILVTTNKHPSNWYDEAIADPKKGTTQGDVNAVLSRIGLNNDPSMHAARLTAGLTVVLDDATHYDAVKQQIRQFLADHWVRRAVLIDDDEEIPIPPAPVPVEEDEIICLNDLPAEIRQNDARPIIRDLLNFDWGTQVTYIDDE